MNMATKNEIFTRYKEEYWKASKKRKGEILNAVVEVTKMHRKAAVRKFRALQLRDPVKQEGRGKPVYYTKDVDYALETVWKAANEPCGELLHPMIVEYVEILRRVGGFEHIRRGKKGLSSTRPSLLKHIIPIFKGPWHDKPPGWGQIDTVAHCGNSLLGDFVYTLNYTDVCTYWVIPRAQWNKGQEATLHNLKIIKKKLPVSLLGLHPDTGSEFINWFAKDWCDEETIDFSRSEPGKKNDNMYVEERNGHVVRKYLGYVRFDERSVVPRMNELYDVLALYLNHFQAVRRTESKKRVGAKIKRKYEKTAKTPYRRTMEHANVPQEAKDRLKQEHAMLNPLLLLREIGRLTAQILKAQKRGRGS